MNRPLFPTTQSIPSYNIGVKVGLRTYQHPLIYPKTQHSQQTKTYPLPPDEFFKFFFIYLQVQWNKYNEKDN
jgi:hypothetical protein